MLNEIEQYVVDCIINNKKPSGRKIAGADIDYPRLYCIALDVLPSRCMSCNQPTNFISIKKGFGKYCSKVCYSKALSTRNKNNNSERNRRFGEALNNERHIKYKNILSKAVDEYNQSDITIAQLSDKYNIERYFLSRYFRENKLTKSKQVIVRRNNLLFKQGFDQISKKLSDRDWVVERIDSGWGSRNFAAELGCCSNYVCEFIRNNYQNLSLKKGGSSYEIQISEFLNANGVECESNTRKIISPLEIDIFIPTHKLGIEINGIYWHGNEHKDKQYHLDKTNKCKDIGIRLLHFTDQEIKYKENIVYSIIRSAIFNTTPIFARKCNIVDISNKTYNQFCLSNHIQGAAGGSVKLGLSHNDKLVAVMSFAAPRFNKKFEWELIRYCNIINQTVIGGASKLFHHFIRTHSPNSIISYSQKRLFDGNMYNKLGMNHMYDTPPSYQWISNNNSLSRYQTQRHKLIGYDSNLTEQDIMKSKGFHQVYDCGQSVFGWYK